MVCWAQHILLSNLLALPLLGKWSDVYGRKKVLLLSNAGTLVGWILFFIALLPPDQKFSFDTLLFGTFTMSLPILVLFLARAMDGITGGNISVANAYLADISSEKSRSSNFGKMAMSANLGFILGPAIAGLLGEGGTVLGSLLPILAALLLSMFTQIVIGFRLKESKRLSTEILISEEGSIRKVFAQECKPCYKGKNQNSNLKTYSS
jgi:MFS transporter, DHA1 family, tetracycline resistance protein